ncbi:LPS export ABC transporter permease LptG [Chachezhania antarctica]|uniref:LPS export ABC transporter permease LptG n=1 Tax=Chachezhania antarctica TaxID=2340860 RepID=UPI000EAF8D4E|nr:LPS export ABC transporter permease LptG [Chachezhania antarctica]
MTLDFYFARRYSQSFLMVAGVFFILILLVELFEQLRRFQDADIGLAKLLQLSLLRTPQSMSDIIPLLVILSSILLFVGLARTSELVVTRAAGRSGIRALVAPVAMTAVIGGLAVTTLNPIAAATAQRYDELSDRYRHGEAAATLSLSGEGLWLRQGGIEEGQSVIHALRVAPDARTLSDVSILTYAPRGGPVRRIRAESATLDNGEWHLTRGKTWPLGPDTSPEFDSQTFTSMTIPTTLTATQILDTIGQTAGTSVYALPQKIRQLREAGFSATRFEVTYQSELARPLFLVAMVLVGAAFTMRHVRFGGTGVAVLASVLLGFALYFMRNFAQVLGENGQLPVTLAAWAPPVAAVMLTAGLLLYAEDG